MPYTVSRSRYWVLTIWKYSGDKGLLPDTPIGATINNKVFVVHGGLGKETYNMSIAEINELDRFVDSPKFPSALSELLGPIPRIKLRVCHRISNAARVGCLERGLANIPAQESAQLIIRSHEVRMNGFSVHHDGLC